MDSRAIAEIVGGTHHGPAIEVRGLATLAAAGAGDLAYAERGASGAAGALLIADAVPDRCCIVVPDPKSAFIAVMHRWFPEHHPTGIHPTAVVDGEVGEGVAVGAHAVVAAGAA